MTVFKSPLPKVDVPNVGLPEFIASRPPEDPEGPLFGSPNPDISSFTFNETLRLAKQVANGLQSFDWWRSSSSKCLCMYAPNHPAYIAVCLGVHMAGGTVSTANAAYGPREIQHQLADSQADAIVTMKGLEKQAADSLGAIRSGSSSGSLVAKIKDLALGGPSLADRIFLIDDKEASNSVFKLGEGVEGSADPSSSEETDWSQKVAFLCYSSGTSGNPKGVRLSHTNLIANILQCRVIFGDVFGKTQFHADVLPQFHCYGLVVSYLALVTGTPRKLFAKFDLETYLKTIQDDKVTFGFVAPPMLLAITKSPLTKKYDVSSLQRLASGAAPLSEALRKGAKEKLGFYVTDGYGMTEMAPIIAVQNPEDIEAAPLSIGHLVSNVELKVVDDEGKELGVGETGELLFRGPNRMLGYNNNEEANKAAFDDDGFFQTGDVGHIDEKEYVHITDRKKDLIKFNGYQVSVAELESILIADPAVSDAGVVPLNSEEKATELPFAYLVAAPGVEKTDAELKRIIDDLGSHVAFYKKLRGGAEWIDAIPKNASGKILHRELREKLKKDKADAK